MDKDDKIAYGCIGGFILFGAICTIAYYLFWGYVILKIIDIFEKFVG